MITLSKAKREYESLLNPDPIGMFSGTVEVVEKRTAKNKVIFLAQVVKYLENEPSEEFVQKEYERIDNRLKMLYRELPSTGSLAKDFASKIVKEYREENQMQKLETQLNMLKYLLEK